MLPDLYDRDGNKLGIVPLSENQRIALDAGATIIIQYHTPQLKRGEVGNRSGSFGVHKEGERLIVDSAEQARQCVQILGTPSDA